MGMRLSSQELFGAFAHPLRHPRPDLKLTQVKRYMTRVIYRLTAALTEDSMVLEVSTKQEGDLALTLHNNCYLATSMTSGYCTAFL